MMPFHVVCQTDLGWLVAKTNINELLRIQATMPIGGAGERCRNRRSRSVDGLPDIAPIDAASDFFDEHRGETLRS